MAEENKELLEEVQETNIGELVAHLKEEGLDDEKILEGLENALHDGAITEEDFEEAKAILAKGKEEEQAKAEELFGLKFVD